MQQGWGVDNIRDLYLPGAGGTAEASGAFPGASVQPHEIPLLISHSVVPEKPFSLAITDLYEPQPTRAQAGLPAFTVRTNVYQEGQALGNLILALNPHLPVQIGQCREADLSKLDFWSQLIRPPVVFATGSSPALIIHNGKRVSIVLEADKYGCLTYAANLGSGQSDVESVSGGNWKLGINFDLSGDTPPLVNKPIPQK